MNVETSEKTASPKECKTQPVSIKAITKIKKYENKHIILLCTALNTVRSKVDVVPRGW